MGIRMKQVWEDDGVEFGVEIPGDHSSGALEESIGDAWMSGDDAVLPTTITYHHMFRNACMNTGPRKMIRIAGKMNKTRGINILTGASLANFSARLKRFDRICSARTCRIAPILTPNSSAWISESITVLRSFCRTLLAIFFKASRRCIPSCISRKTRSSSSFNGSLLRYFMMSCKAGEKIPTGFDG